MEKLLKNTPFLKKAKELKSKIPYLVEKVDLRIGEEPKNFLIEGDNLHTLVTLLSTHKGKIDLCFYDPDNTISSQQRGKLGDGFDNHVWLQEHILKISLQRELLSESGLLVVCLRPNIIHFAMAGNNKISGLISLFGNNFLEFINSSRTRANVSPSFYSKDHEFILVFSKKGDPIVLKGIPKDFSRYSNPDKDPRGLWVPCDLTAKEGKKNKNIFLVTNPVTKKKYKPSSGRQWGFSKQKIEEMINDKRIVWPKKSKGRLGYKLFMTESKNQAVSSLDLDFPTAQGTMELKKFGKPFYRDPKSPLLIKFLIEQLLSNRPKSIILDLTAGSGTLGQVVLQYNKTEGTDMSFILCSNDFKQVGFIYKRLSQTIQGNHKVKSSGGTLGFFSIKMASKQSLKEDTKFGLLSHLPDILKLKYGVFLVKSSDLYTLMESKDQKTKVLINRTLNLSKQSQGIIIEEGLLSPQDCPYIAHSTADSIVANSEKILKITSEIE